jgi:very-short-patch-repair endonuclease
VRVHRRTGLRDEDIVVRDGIRTTAPARTLVDLSAINGAASIERMVNEADRLDLVDPETLRASLGAYRGQRGVARLRAVLEPRTFRRTRSGLERCFLRLVERAGLPTPLTRQWVNGFEVDFFWPDIGLVVETDGLRYHRTAARQARDRLRDQAHTAAGMTPLRFTEDQIDFDVAYVIETLRTVARRLDAAQTTGRLTGAPGA